MSINIVKTRVKPHKQNIEQKKRKKESQRTPIKLNSNEYCVLRIAYIHSGRSDVKTPVTTI